MDTRDDDTLVDVLAARRGVVCVVGAGGKKTVLYRLAALHPGRVALTATAHTPPWPAGVADAVVTGAAATLREGVRAARAARVVAFAGPADKPGRYSGLAPAIIAEVIDGAGFDLCLVKADGARSRWLKAPAAGEPVLPAAFDTLICVASARALGQPLDERIAHRPERIAMLAGLRVGDVLEPVHLARLFTHREGALKGADGAIVIPLINMVDTPELAQAARAAARLALDLCPRLERVVLARLRGTDAAEVVAR